MKFDRDFKNVFHQEADKVTEIANDMKLNGFDKSRPIVITEDKIIVDGHSRFMAAKKAGLNEVPVVLKKFDSRDETLEYEYKMQLNSRRLTDGEYFDAFLKLDEMRRKSLDSKGKSDEAIAQKLNRSTRQISKMREIAKKANTDLLAKIKSGKISLNKAYEQIKNNSKSNSFSSISQTGKGINCESFRLGFLFALENIKGGKKRKAIEKDSRIAKLSLGSLELTKEELEKISNRFGIS